MCMYDYVRMCVYACRHVCVCSVVCNYDILHDYNSLHHICSALKFQELMTDLRDLLNDGSDSSDEYTDPEAKVTPYAYLYCV
jgi:hypothetical protein